MSGGVDSTCCALLLREHYQVRGFFMRLAQPNFEQDRKRAETIAEKCNIPLQIIDLRGPFQEKVLRYFADSYHSGSTPNPCMICNPVIKFGLFLDAIKAHGMDAMATGHYANITKIDNCLHLQEGKDSQKDQSYFLARLSQYQLSHVLFPLGKMAKSEVYDLVEEHGFTDFRGQESQDICFLQQTESVGSFLAQHTGEQAVPGDIVNDAGEILGRHNGICNYTIGQRKGLGISAATPLYVKSIRAEDKQIVVGMDEELLQSEVEVQDLLWSCDTEPATDKTYRVRIRYGHRGGKASLHPLPGNHCRICFAEKQRAVTRGQFAVIYDQDHIIGSGEIL